MQSLRRSSSSGSNSNNQAIYANINDLPAELLNTIFEEIRKSGFKRALMPLNRSLQVYYLKVLYYDVNLLLEAVPRLLESIGENLELLKLINILTIQQENAHRSRLYNRDIQESALEVLFESASEVKELNIFGSDRFEDSLASKRVLGDFEKFMPLLTSFAIKGRYGVPLIRLLIFFGSHPLLKSLDLDVNIIITLADTLFAQGFEKVESISMKNSFFQATLHILSFFCGVERLTLISNGRGDDTDMMIGSVTSGGTSVERGASNVENVKYLKYLDAGSFIIFGENNWNTPASINPLRGTLSQFKSLETLEIDFPLVKEKLWETIIEDLPQLRLLIVAGAVTSQCTLSEEFVLELEEFVSQFKARGRKLTIQLDQLNFVNPGKRGLSYNFTLEELYDQGRGEELEGLRENLCWKLDCKNPGNRRYRFRRDEWHHQGWGEDLGAVRQKVCWDSDWKRSEPNFDGLELEVVRKIWRISQESQTVNIVTRNLIESLENEEAYQKEFEFCEGLGNLAVRFPVVAVEYNELTDHLLNAEEEEESVEGKIGRIELQDEPFRLALEQLLNIKAGTTLYLKPAGWSRRINTEIEDQADQERDEERERKAQFEEYCDELTPRERAQYGIRSPARYDRYESEDEDEVEDEVEDEMARAENAYNEDHYIDGLAAINSACEDYGRRMENSRGWKVEVEILERVVKFTRLHDDHEEYY